jgi:nucleoside-diphosphate-sugar epimerase
MTHRIFVTGGSGFIGSAFVRHALSAENKIQVLTRSEPSAERVRTEGAEAIIGDLNSPGPWQQAAAQADVVLHLAQPETYGTKVTRKHAEHFREQRLKMDTNLLDCLRPESVHRVIYIGGTSYYGHQGDQMVAEDTIPHPKGWGPYIAPAIEALPTYVAKGLPIIQAFPAWVYGPGSWMAEYTLEPLYARKALVNLRRPDPIISVVHVEDVARALLHLIDHGAVGQRYFITDDQPLPAAELAALTAQAMGVPLRIRRFPVFISRLAVGPIVTDSLNTEAKLSNRRIKATGFEFKFPTCIQGVPDVVTLWLDRKTSQTARHKQ